MPNSTKNEKCFSCGLSITSSSSGCKHLQGHSKVFVLQSARSKRLRSKDNPISVIVNRVSAESPFKVLDDQVIAAQLIVISKTSDSKFHIEEIHLADKPLRFPFQKETLIAGLYENLKHATLGTEMELLVNPDAALHRFENSDVSIGGGPNRCILNTASFYIKYKVVEIEGEKVKCANIKQPDMSHVENLMRTHFQ